MDYHLETLGDDRFQKLCQALLISEHPEVQCLPLNQADGGRDAVILPRLESGYLKQFVVYQVKFSENYKSRNERDVIQSLVKTEAEKVERLKALGATKYVLMTNVAGTAGLENGSIDRVNEILTKEFGIPSYCWWRDDIERRIDADSDIKWSYPEITRGTDVLGLLLGTVLGDAQRRRDRAVRNYIISQHTHDEELKFKQVELQNQLLKLFIDVPVKFSANTSELLSAKIRNIESLDYFLMHKLMYHSYERGEDYIHAADALLGFNDISAFSSIVLEGAPGQGKSTITQYICQVQRMRFLQKTDEIAMLPVTHNASRLRLPFRVDLRDFATWVSGKSPFSTPFGQPLPEGTPSSLEAFLCAQIADAAGGIEFSLADFNEVVNKAHILVVLDGFDEVADAPTRAAIVKQVSLAARRLHDQTRSARVIVTSRPSAFANSPGFSTDWAHLELQSLSQKGIEDYASKWMDAKAMPERQQDQFRSILINRLEQPHIRDLARNPMQLTILLSLINTKGLSLPDKRTALYDAYIELFFSREAEKSLVVRDHRDLLIAIHRHIAWILQIDAESGKGNGSISSDDLRKILRAFLESQGHPVDLVDQLFTGMVERVVALVSRVIGTFEFEVQPLREYFCARHLYETAPYSPIGSEFSGTKPERFLAMARNGYWLNVTRFYAGCYSTGELSSIVDGILELSEDEAFVKTTHASILASMLLSDWVFSQQPLVVKRVIAFITRQPYFRLYLSGHKHSLVLATGCGREALVEFAKSEFSKDMKRDYGIALSAILVNNQDRQDRKEFWYYLRNNLDFDVHFWLTLGDFLQITETLTPQEWKEIWVCSGELGLQHMISAASVSLLISDEEVRRAFFAAAFDGQIRVYGHSFSQDLTSEASVLNALGLLNISGFVSVFTTSPHSFNLRDLFVRYSAQFVYHTMSETNGDVSKEEDGVLAKLSEIIRESLKEPILNWQTSSQPWRYLVDSGVGVTGEKPYWRKLAVISSSIRSRIDKGEGGQNLFDESVSLVDRARFARLKAGNYGYWKDALQNAQTRSHRVMVLSLLLSWCTDAAINNLVEDVSEILGELSLDEWREIKSNVVSVNATDPNRKSIHLPKGFFDGGDESKARLLVSLITRASGKEASRWLSEFGPYLGNDPTIHGGFINAIQEDEFEGRQDRAFISDYIRESYKMGYCDEPRQMRNRPGFERMIDAGLSDKILSNLSEYPMYVVAAADRKKTALAGAAAPKVGAVAKREKWF